MTNPPRAAPPPEVAAPAAARALEPVWEDRPGIPGFLTTVDHKRIGLRYIVTAFVFFVLAGVQATLLRAQLATPDGTVLSPEAYNRLFTMHGTTMIFLFNTPVLAGFVNYVMPLQLGARDMAYPRLNAFSYWVFLLSGLFLYTSFAVGEVPDGGWFGYVPLTDDTYSPGPGMDFWTLGIVFLGISTTVGAINTIVTVFKLRAPGLSVSRLPLFTWSALAMAFMICFALPAITLGPLMLALDRALQMRIFDPVAGGSSVLYQHLFWFWGHPEVYILFLPATGIVSTIVPVAARRPISGYVWVVAAIVATAFLSFGVWVHHMFATGLPLLTLSFFSAASLLFALPSGVQVFAWLATLWRAAVRWSTALWYCLGFVVIFVLGGITGVMVAVVPFDWQVHDTYFVVAHFHYVLVGGVVFPVFAGLYFWFPKWTGRLVDERLGRISFWLMFAGMNLTFFPHHLLGFAGMPRRVYTYQEGLGWEGFNLLSTIGGWTFALGFVVTVAAFAHARLRGAPAGANPWGAATLEWATTSPPAPYNFAQLPVVLGRDPLWGALAPSGVTLTGEHHETVESAGLAGAPEHVLVMPAPSYWPLLLALATAAVFVGILVRSLAGTAVAALAVVICTLGWLWPPPEHELGEAGG